MIKEDRELVGDRETDGEQVRNMETSERLRASKRRGDS